MLQGEIFEVLLSKRETNCSRENDAKLVPVGAGNKCSKEEETVTEKMIDRTEEGEDYFLKHSLEMRKWDFLFLIYLFETIASKWQLARGDH